MEFNGELTGASRDVSTGKYNITFTTDELPASVNDTKGTLRVQAVKNRKRRSLDSNAYAWLLIGKIADKLGSSKEEVYCLMLLKYGQPFLDDNGVPEMISVKSEIDVSKFGLYAKFVGSGYVNGKEFKHYMILRGSSTYDTKEMSIFIDGIVSEAKELGIDTIPRVELEKMKAKWGI